MIPTASSAAGLRSSVPHHQAPPADRLLKLLASDDRFEVWAARRLLERMPEAEWGKPPCSLPPTIACLRTVRWLCLPRIPHARRLIRCAGGLAQTDAGFCFRPRLCGDAAGLPGGAILQGELKPEEAPGLRRQLAEEFPAGNSFMNRELARLLIYLQEDSLIPRYLAYLRSNAPDVDKLHVALHLHFLEAGWTPAERMELFEYYELANRKKGGGSYARYIINAARDVAQQLGEERCVLSSVKAMRNAGTLRWPPCIAFPRRWTTRCANHRTARWSPGKQNGRFRAAAEGRAHCCALPQWRRRITGLSPQNLGPRSRTPASGFGWPRAASRWRKLGLFGPQFGRARTGGPQKK